MMSINNGYYYYFRDNLEREEWELFRERL
jgi:hypothetical protein